MNLKLEIIESDEWVYSEYEPGRKIKTAKLRVTVRTLEMSYGEPTYETDWAEIDLRELKAALAKLSD